MTGSLPPEQLRRRCNPAVFNFETTASLDELTTIVGQDRAIEAITFAIQIRRDGYNLFAAGPTGSGKNYTVKRFLSQQAASEATPDDWCYVHNFQDARKPRTLRLPAGKARVLGEHVATLIKDLQAAIPAAFKSESYRTSFRNLEQTYQERKETFFQEIQRRANAAGLALIQGEEGIAIAPIRDGELMPPEKLQSLPQEEQAEIAAGVKQIKSELEEQVSQFSEWERELVQQIRKLNEEICANTISPLFTKLSETFIELPQVTAHLKALQEDICEHHMLFMERNEDSRQSRRGPPGQGEAEGVERYQINVLVDHSDTTGAPVVHEDHPTLANLLGRIEQRSMYGALSTDFSLIRAGSLHRANGGYLIIDAMRLLDAPMSWDMLKRAIRANAIRFEPISSRQEATLSLEPEAIPLSLKIVLIGERGLCTRLEQLDADFRRMFKVVADFDSTMARTEESVQQFARLLATLARQDDLKPISREGLAAMIEHGSRLASDGTKLSTHIQSLWSILHESDYQAMKEGADTITAQHVQDALDAWRRRHGRLREKSLESFLRGTVLIESDGTRIGQLNGLSVLTLGEAKFGQPNRISARVRPGQGEIVNIEREATLSGPIHDKGVLIITGLLGSRYTLGWPLSLTASLVFEQSYGGVDGDSASLAELCAILSALGRVPLRQGIAVTGSINQHGEVQAVGGINDKIEGFFALCQARGLTGQQGVIIPAANREDLMLDAEVVEAARQQRFHIWAVAHLDEAMELLSGIQAGDEAVDGRFRDRTVNSRVQNRLMEFAHIAQQWAMQGTK